MPSSADGAPRLKQYKATGTYSEFPTNHCFLHIFPNFSLKTLLILIELHKLCHNLNEDVVAVKYSETEDLLILTFDL